MRVAAIQLTSGCAVDENLPRVARLIRDAVTAGAEFVATPEATCHLRFPLHSAAVDGADDHRAIRFFSALAAELGIVLLIGSLFVRSTCGERVHNRAVLFGRDGSVLTSYDKIHLFDVDLAQGESYRESQAVIGGTQAVTYPISDALTLGLSICYDVRFPHLFRDMAHEGANVLCVPAAFTIPTGRAHWEVLLRARAIENGAYVIAPAQVGRHENDRHTYGHSMIISPWGEILACRTEGEGVVLADLDVSDINTARHAVPSLQHDKSYEV